METIVVAIISLVGTLTGSYFSQRKTTHLMAYQIDELRKEVKKHNGLIDRMYRVEGRQDVFDEGLKIANRRITDLEKGGKGE